MARVGLIFLERPSLGEQIELVRHAKQRAFESVWACEIRRVRDGASVRR